MSTMTVTMTSGDGVRRERSPRGGKESARRGGQARVALAVAVNLAKRSTGCWIAYFVAWLLVTVFPLALVASVSSSADEAVPAVWLGEYGVALIGAAIGAIAAACRVFPYVFKQGAADFYGSLPLKRAGLFGACALAGFVPLVAVEALVALVLAALTFALPAIGISNCGWWLALAVTFTFVFYATALLCVQLSGSHSCAVWLFLGANFFIVVVELVFRFFAGYLIWGLDFGSSVSSTWTSPLLGMGNYGISGWSFRGISDGSVADDSLTSNFDFALLIDWRALGLYVAFGLVCVLAAFLLNGIRPLEQAGETVPYRALRIVLACATGFIGALVLGVVAVLFEGAAAGTPLGTPQALVAAVALGIGGLFGTIAGAAYLHGDTGKFRIPWKMGAAVGVVALAVGLLCAFDALGVESYVPQSAQVKSVKVSSESSMQNTSFSSQEGVEGICRAHEQMLGLEDHARDLAADYSSDSVTIGFTYTLDDGRTCKRSYTIPTKGKEEKAVLSALTASCNSREGIDSRLDTLRRANARNDLEVDYDSYDDEDQVHNLSFKQVSEFISGPLAKDARNHGALDLDLADPSGAYQVGKLGAVDINLSDDADDTVWTTSVPVSRKGTPAICAWLKDAGMM